MYIVWIEFLITIPYIQIRLTYSHVLTINEADVASVSYLSNYPFHILVINLRTYSVAFACVYRGISSTTTGNSEYSGYEE